MFFPYNASEDSISVFFNGRMHSIPKTDSNFAALAEELAQPEHDFEVIEALIDKPKMMARLTEGLVTVVGSTVYYKGEIIHSTMAYRLLDVLNAGQNPAVWARFLERVMANPSQRSRECLYDFLNVWKAPLTEDGHFIAFKRVREDYTPIHTGGKTFYNTPGSVIEVGRDEVDENPDNQCSYGLHVAASSYLGHFATAHCHRTVACKVDPADVVAVPADYGFAKMRVCRYLVLGDAEESFYNNAEEHTVSFAGTEEASGEIEDLHGLPICYNAMHFSECWLRDISATVEVGDMVSPSAHSDSEELPTNRFLVGIVASVSELDEDAVEISVEWQDGTGSASLVLAPGNVGVSDVVAVTYIFDEEEEEERPYCGDCGSEEVDFEGEVCDDCEAEEERLWQEECDEEADRIEEADHIAETGLTRDGNPPNDDWVDAYAYTHNVDRFTADTADEEDDEDAVDTEESEMGFNRAGKTYSASEVKTGIANYGQRGYSRMTGIPRTTLQDWMLKIEATE